MHDKGRSLRLIASVLGLIAVLDVAILGALVIEGFLLLNLLLPSFMAEAIITLALTITSGILLCLGSLSLYMRHATRGAVLYLVAWAITVVIYLWGVFLWEFRHLFQMGLTSIVFLVPALTSGIIALLASRMENSTP